MRRLLVPVLLAVLFFISTVHAQKPIKVIGPGIGAGRTLYVQNYNRTLSKDTIYILTGIYTVDSTYTLTIEPGTLVLGDTVATLIIARGGKIVAQGEKYAPIVFAPNKPRGQRAPGDWGGIIILGNAPTNRSSEPLIEGGVFYRGTYGGPDPHDSSGVLHYVRIEYPGYRFQPNNEINGLTLGGVGDRTSIHHVQVSYSLDDAYEWFGGTVNAKYLVALGSQDDDFDTDFGFSGKLQFLFGLRDPDRFDSDASNGFESDNDGSGTSAQPFTQATFSNVTLVGPQRDNNHISLPPGNNHVDGLRLRRATQLKIYNSIVMGYPNGLNIDGNASASSAVAGDLQVRNTSIQATATPLRSSATTWTTNIVDWFNTTGWGNLGSAVRQPDDIGLVNMASLTNPDPRPSRNSEPATAGTDFTNPNLQYPFFTTTTYRGAFDPAKPREEQWDYGWTTYDPQNADYTNGVTGIEEVPLRDAPQGYSLFQNFPNPFNPSTVIRYALPTTSRVTLRVYNVLGQAIATLVNGVVEETGIHEVTFEANNLPSGVYFYQLQTNGFTQVRKMMLAR